MCTQQLLNAIVFKSLERFISPENTSEEDSSIAASLLFTI